MVVSYRRFGTTYRSHLQEKINPETSVNKYQSTLRKIPQECRSDLRSGGCLKPRT